MNFFNCGSYSLDLNKKVYIMGILNVTPDSFSDGGLFLNPKEAIKHAINMQNDGVDIIDIGAQSTRPGHTKISAKKEWERLEPVLMELKNIIKIPISVDTFYPEVAKKALDLGASIINDVTGFRDNKMWDIASYSDCGCIIMHDGPYNTTKRFFKESLAKAQSYGIDKSRICLDPGIGFGKDLNDNINIIKNLKDLKIDSVPLLMALSKKSFIGKICDEIPTSERLPGTIVANSISIMNGANIIRVHDVKEAVTATQVLKALI